MVVVNDFNGVLYFGARGNHYLRVSFQYFERLIVPNFIFIFNYQHLSIYQNGEN